MAKKIEEKVEELVKPIIENLGYKLYDVIYEKEKTDFYLRIFIENVGNKGISLDDCEAVNNAITDILDEKDYIKDEYYLEVSSTGIEKNLRKTWQMNEAKGLKVEAKTYAPINGSKNIIGILNFANDEKIKIDDVEILRKDIASLKTIFEW